ncbi:TRAP transporter small permease [Brevibacillus sp. B_LB10_24]|uniref:TRAP transporter small permease n=1 Tax=Brevibacillus sp. B_LB10_24 TaxID=3380645 RepID=UPI0038B71F63
MRIISTIVTRFTQFNKWLAYASLIAMMIIVGICAITRGFGTPIIGDIELVQMTMVSLIVGALAFAEKEKAHIEIGIIVDHFPMRVQYFLDLVSALLKGTFAFLVAYVFINKMNFVEASVLLRVPFFYFKILLIIGFVGWGLESIRQTVESVHLLTGKKETEMVQETDRKAEAL